MDRERALNELEADLHATAEDIFADASELRAIEQVKAGLSPKDPRLLPLAKKADELGEQIAAKTGSELEIARDATGAR